VYVLIIFFFAVLTVLCVYPHCIFLILSQSTRVTDRQADRQTGGQNITTFKTALP